MAGSFRSYSTVKKAGVTAGDTDWNKVDEYFTFTRGRFVVNEEDQMKRREVHFNMNELVQVAARSVNAERCVNVDKCPDGMYNKCFVLTMNDGREVIAKVPNPNAGIPHYTTASEVATMDFVRNTLKTPVPKVYAWNSKADDLVGAEYIIMDKMPGVQLAEVWNDMKLKDKMQLRLNLAVHQAAWLSVSFRQYGGLYYRQDLNVQPDTEHLYTSQEGEKQYDPRFAIGPMTGRHWVDCGRVALRCDRGPWRSTHGYHKAVGLRELEAVTSISPLPRQTVMVCGPGLYQPSVDKKFSAITSYLRVLETLLPADLNITVSSLWHNDLHEENIFVDREDPTKILGIIDWQSVDLLPLFDHNLDPAFIQCEGSIPQDLERPQLEDTSKMSNEERIKVTKNYFDKALFVASRKIMHKKLPSAYRAIEYQRSEVFDTLTIAKRVFEFGEAHLHGMLVELQNKWLSLPSVEVSSNSKKFPLGFSDTTIAEIQDDWGKSVRGMQIMNDIRSQLGPLWPDKDAVSHDLYGEAKSALRAAKEELMEEFAYSEEEKIEFEKAWPFDD